MPVTALELDLMAAHGCSVPQCTHQHEETFFLHGRCHMHGGLEVSYTRGSKILRVACAECHKLVAEIAVKEAHEKA